MNLVERFSRDITVSLRDGSFGSTRELASSITTFLALHDAQPSDTSEARKVKISCVKSRVLETRWQAR